MGGMELLITDRVQLNVVVCVGGVLILLLGLLRHFFNTKFPASTIMVAMLVGIILGPSVSGVVDPKEWGDHYALVEEVSRLIISIQLMATALGISFHYLVKAWRTQLILITIGLAFMWVSSGFIIYGFFATTNNYTFTIWEALLIGSCIAPTDPIVASAVADSALAIRLVPARLRHTIAAESSLNDGTGFPFFLLCLRFVERQTTGVSVGEIFKEWFVHDILWEVGVGIVLGLVIGYVIGRLLVWAEPSKLHDQQLLVALTVALAFGFMGGATLLGVDGFIVVILGGVVYARVVEGDKRGAESQLQETVDLIFSTVVFALFGLVIPFEQWYHIGWWQALLLCLCILLFRRIPWMFVLVPLLKKEAQIETVADVLFLGYFGPIGVGAIFYALFATEALGDDRIWVVVSLIVFTQVIIFGVTDTSLILWYGSTNPNYIRRRRRKIQAIQQAAAEIMHIQEHLADELEHLPSSPNRDDDPDNDPNHHERPSIFNLDPADSPEIPLPVIVGSRPSSRRNSVYLHHSNHHHHSPSHPPSQSASRRGSVSLSRNPSTNFGVVSTPPPRTPNRSRTPSPTPPTDDLPTHNTHSQSHVHFEENV